MNIIIHAHKLSKHGGLERVIAELANAMSDRGHKISLFSDEPLEVAPVYTLNNDIQRIYFTYDGDSRRLEATRAQILACEPDVLLSPASGTEHWLWCAVLHQTGIPWIYSEHSSPELIEHERWNVRERRAVLCAADAVHLLFNDFIASIPEYLQDRISVIPNAVPLPAQTHFSDKTASDSRLLLSVGRLASVKQHYLLIQAMAVLTRELPEWRLEIWGEGEERNNLAREIRALDLTRHVRLCGLTHNPHAQYARAGLFCIPSRFEGFGLVTVEAMSHGLPVVGFSACPGTNALIRHNENGMLAPEMTVESLCAALRALMIDAEARRRMGENARKSAQRFAPERVYDAWEKLFLRTAAMKGRTRLQTLEQREAWPSEAAASLALLRAWLGRRFLFLPDSAWLKLFFVRRPKLKRLVMPLRRMQKRFCPLRAKR